MTVRISLPADFRYDEVLLYLNRNAQEPLHAVDAERRTVTKAFRGQRGPLLVRIAMAADGELDVAFPLAEPDETERAAAAHYIAEWLDLGRDLAPFYRLAENDPILRKVVPRYRGMRIVGVGDLFEALAWAIAGQQISLHVAYGLKKRLVEAYGDPVAFEGRDYWLFPEAARIAGLAEEELQALKFTRSKAAYLLGVAKLMDAGELSKSSLLAEGDLAAMERRLTAIRGVGKWTANYAVMRCLRHPDAFPLADVGLHNALKLVLGLDSKPSLAEIERWAESWAGWRAYATFYLWRALTPS